MLGGLLYCAFWLLLLRAINPGLKFGEVGFSCYLFRVLDEVVLQNGSAFLIGSYGLRVVTGVE